MVSNAHESSSASEERYNNYPDYAPRIWHGMTVSSWAQLLIEHRFQLNRYPMSFWITFFSVVNSSSNRLQALRYGKLASDTPLVADPIFVLGHWRTGTTMLHSLFQLDPEFWTPTTYECLSPGHFMLTRKLFPHLMKFPTRRPMDNMSMGWDQPQEDEFVLCTKGLSSVYRNIAFPYDQVGDIESLNASGWHGKARNQWKDTLLEFVQYLNLAHSQRLVLKSPTHTGRIQMLLELFPNAKFVHLARDPHEFVPSTLHLWRSLEVTSSLIRNPNKIDREDYVFDCFARMYDRFDAARALIPDGNYCQLTYRQLTENTEVSMRDVYSQLSLGDFQRVARPIRDYVEAKRDYRRNKHEVPAALVDRIDQSCRFYQDNFLADGESTRAA